MTDPRSYTGINWQAVEDRELGRGEIPHLGWTIYHVPSKTRKNPDPEQEPVCYVEDETTARCLILIRPQRWNEIKDLIEFRINWPDP